jgi:hypothetical protein
VGVSASVLQFGFIFGVRRLTHNFTVTNKTPSCIRVGYVERFLTWNGELYPPNPGCQRIGPCRRTRCR